MPDEKSQLPRALGGKRLRLSMDSPQSAMTAGLSFLAPPDHETQWRNWNLDSSTLDRMAPAELLELLVDLSPDISRALWDFLRLCNPGWECKAFRVGGEETEEPRGQAVLDAFFADLKELYGSADVVINRLYTSAFMRGGFFAELILDNAGRVPLDLATPDPRWLQWRLVKDPQRGPVWQPYQWVGTEPVPLTRETIRYVPVDPLPGKPYGRALAAPSLFTTLFALGMLHDLRRVVQQQGYPRLDLAISLEQLVKAMPTHLQADQAAMKDWLDEVVREVTSVYSDLEPDDAYVHTDVVTVNRPVGTVDSDSLGAIDGLMAALERLQVRALKSTPLMMAMPDGMSEANANRQWEVHSAGVKALQHLCEGLLEHLLAIVLRVQGIQAVVQFRFAELRAAELHRDALVEQLNIENARAQYDHGWIDQDTAAQRGGGVEKADQEEPRNLAPQGEPSQPAEEIKPEPGSDRAGSVHTREAVQPKGSAPTSELPDADDLAEQAKAAATKAQVEWDDALPEFAGLLDAAVI